MPVAFNPQIRSVLDALDSLGGPPVPTMTPDEARRQPTVADAVRAVLWREGTSLSPEPVGAVEDIEVPAPQGPVPVRIYWPLGSDSGPLPVLVYAHGGGWVFGDLDDYDATPRALTNRAGCIVVSVGYRHAPEHRFPAAYDDVLAATRWVMGTIAELSGDPARIALVGEGVGATMALAACRALQASGGSPQPVVQVLMYPVTDLTRTDWATYRENLSTRPLSTEAVEWAAEHVVAQSGDVNDLRLSPNLAVRSELAGLPPTLVITAEHDPLRDQGEAFGRLLLEAGVKATTLRFEGVTHDFVTMNPVVAPAQAAASAVAKHLREAFSLKGEAAPTVRPDLFQVLAADHAGFRTLLARLELGRGDRRELTDQLRHGLSAQAAMVDAVLGSATAGLPGPADTDELLRMLDVHPLDGAGADPGLRAVRAAIDERRVTQERVLAEMRVGSGDKRMREVGHQALQARRTAPDGGGGGSAREMAHAG
ncbi:MAG: alpha/beta hydrolase [Actinomycetota bacterium]|nr:alpha/beta hydrolase [Actinomycetota bacterium]